MRGEPVELSCPFCDKGRIQCIFIAGATHERKTGGRGIRSVRKSSDIWLIQSNCSICSKSKEEIEKKLKELNII